MMSDSASLFQGFVICLISFFLAQLSSETVYFLAVILGSASGSLILLRFRRERSFNKSLLQFFSGVLVGTILSITIGEYFSIENWKYLMGLSGLMGLTGLMIAKSLIVVFNEDFLTSVIKEILKKVLVLLDNDKSSNNRSNDTKR